MALDSRLSNERKRVTVLFADISESTRFVEKLDPEDAVQVLSPVVDDMAQVVQQFDGTLVRVMGDGIMAIFGAPIAQEHHAHRACHAALRMLQVIESRRVAGDAVQAADVRLHIGLATGEVVAGFLGEDLRAGYDATGFTIHLASRLQGLAPSGCIYISRATYKAVSDRFDCEFLGQKKIRGSAELVEVYRLAGLRPEARTRRAAVPRSTRTPLIGRQDELAALSSLVDGLMAGRGAAVAILGDAGIGKSRLIGEFRNRAAGLPVLWLEGASLSYGRTLSYWPFLEILRALAGIAEDDDEADAWRKLETRIAGIFAAETDDVLPYIATFLNLRVRRGLEERVKYLDGEAIRRQVFRTMRLLFERLAAETPTIVVLEDAFWMDLSSAALLAHLMPLIQGAPILICLVTRGVAGGADEAVRAAAAQDHPDRYSEIELHPLSPGDTNQLIDSMLRLPDLPRSIRKTIQATTEGNPLYIEEVIRTLIETKAIVHDRDGGSLQPATPGAVHFEIPGSIQSVIMSRVDQLEEKAKETLKTASVIGRLFFIRVLAMMMESEAETRDSLVTLRRADFILDRRREPEPECMFKHVLVQEATYDSVLLKRRRELHALAGAALEQVFSGRLEEMYGLLAYHYARAELWEKAQDYLLKAGDQADRLAANEEALAYFQSATDAYLRAFDQEATPIWRATIARKIGEAFYRKGDNPEARENFRQALGLLGSRDPRSSIGLYLEMLKQVAIQVVHRLLPMQVFDRRIGNASPADEERVRIYIMLWWLNFFESPPRTLLYSLKTLNESERCGALVGIVHSCSTLGFISNVLGAPGIALLYHRRGTARARESTNPVAVGHAALGMGWHGSYTGDWPSALEHFRRSAEVSRRAGDLRQWGSAIWGITLLLCGQGQFAAAWRHAHELSDISEASGDQVNLRWSRLAEAMILLRVGAVEAAELRLRSALEDGLAASDWQICTRAICELARASLVEGRIAEAGRLIGEAEATVANRHLKGHHVSEVRGVAAAVILARLESAEARTARLERQAHRACGRALRAGRVFRGALPQALRLQGSQCWLCGRSSQAEQWWQRSLAVAEGLGAIHELGLTNVEIGRRTGRPLLVSRGETILAETRRGFDPCLLQ